MFGSNDKDQSDTTQQAGGVAGNPMPTPLSSENLVSAPPDPVITPSAPPLNDAMAAPPEPMMPTPPPADENKDSAKPGDSDDTAHPEPPTLPPGTDDGHLLDIKQQALHSLAPLVDQLEQTPEEKFKTTMMLIQASDNANLISEAYDAANSISDEKTRAQALLDVVNEINYFTQHQNHDKT